MEIFENAAVIWFVIGFVCLVFEFIVPGIILMFFAFGAWIVAILSLFIDLSINLQLIIFLCSSLLSILLFRKWVKSLIYSRRVSNEIIEDEFIGRIGTAATAITPGNIGKVEFKGTTWDARSEVLVEKGENVLIVGNESILLIVKPSKA